MEMAKSRLIHFHHHLLYAFAGGAGCFRTAAARGLGSRSHLVSVSGVYAGHGDSVRGNAEMALSRMDAAAGEKRLEY